MPQLLRYATLALLGSLLTLPFLGAHHFLPIATFHQEWLAGVLGLLLLGVLLIGNDSVQWQMPRVALLPLFFVVALWLQWAAGIGVLFESASLASLYLIWASLMMIGTCRLELRFGRDDLANAIALALLIGALLLAGTGIAQLLLPGIGLPWIFPYRGVVEGNIAQSNSFAAYLWIGVAAGLHLHLRGRLAWPMTIAATLPLLSCSLLSGSRSVYFYAAALTLWLIVQARSETTRAPRRRALICAATLLPALLLLQGLLTVCGASISSAQRLASQGSYDPVRLTLWRAALEMFIEHPLMGSGFDSYSREFFARIERFPINGAGIPEHSHNLLTEVTAEFGLMGLAPLLLMGLMWLYGLFHSRLDAASRFAIPVLLVIGIHAMLEYPLWYAHFLAIAAIMFALTDARRLPMRISGRHRLLAGLLIATSLLVMLSLRRDYEDLETAAQGRDANGLAIMPEERRERLLNIYGKTLWRPYAALQFAAQMPIEDQDLDVRLALMQEASHFSPIRQAVFREAALLAIAGRTAEAEALLIRAMASYPSEIPFALAMFESAASAPALQPLTAMLRQRSF